MLSRRGLIGGLGLMLAAPAIVRTPGLLMQISPFKLNTKEFFELEVQGKYSGGIVGQLYIFTDITNVITKFNSRYGPIGIVAFG